MLALLNLIGGRFVFLPCAPTSGFPPFGRQPQALGTRADIANLSMGAWFFMRKSVCRNLVIALVSGAAAMSAAVVHSQQYPQKPVRVVVPAAAGGPLDIVARLTTGKLTPVLGQTFIVDNRGGAGGAIGAGLVTRAPADGYTLLFTSSSAVSVNPNVTNALPDPLGAFSPIILIGTSPMVLVVHPSVPAKSVKELIALAKKNPGSLTFGTNGVGSLSHVTAELFMQRAGIKIVHVPYKGAAPAVVDTIAGNVSLLFVGYPNISGHLKANRLRALAVTSARRADVAPDIPTMSEAALPGFESTQWWAVYGPAGLSSEIVSLLNKELNRVLDAPDVRSKIESEGGATAGGTPQDLASYHRADYERWKEVIKRAGIKAK